MIKAISLQFEPEYKLALEDQDFVKHLKSQVADLISEECKVTVKKDTITVVLDAPVEPTEFIDTAGYVAEAISEAWDATYDA